MLQARILTLLVLGSACSVAWAQSAPSAYLRNLDAVEARQLPALDVQRLTEEDRMDALLGNPPRFAVPVPANISPATDGEWEAVDGNTAVWRYRVKATGAVNINLGFTRYQMPPSAQLTVWSADGKKHIGPYGAEHNFDHGQLWTPIIGADDVFVQLRVNADERDKVVLKLGSINHGYRGFDAAMHAKSGACNMDVNCLTASEPWASWRELARATGTYSTGGSTFCTGSLINTPRNDKALLFNTAAHCGINAGNAASMVVYWNYEQSTCRLPGSGASGGAGDGPTNQTTSGATFLATNSSSDFTVVRLSGAANPAYNLYWAGWDRNSADRDCGPEPENLCAGIHHPNTDEKRITFVEEDYVPRSYNNPTPPGDGTHWWARWDPTPIYPPNPAQTIPPQVTEPGSSGSPLYTKERRFIGQLHGGPSACGATGNNLSDYYGRLSVSWEGGGTASTRARDHFDPDGTGAMTTNGRGECTAPAAPATVTATATAPNTIQVSWTAVPSITTYRVYRSNGTCPGTSFAQIAEVTSGTTYDDNTVSGGSSYSYKVTAVDTAQPCESPQSTCGGATATGTCSLPPTFAGAGSAASPGNSTCSIDVNWAAATGNCGGSGTLRYNVYRSTTAGFTPGGANRVQACGTATTYHDTDVVSGTRYYYAVRAEDTAASGGGGACSGVEETNNTQRSAEPNGPYQGATIDDVEGAGAADNYVADGSGSGANFAIVTGGATVAHSPTHAWFTNDPDTLSDRRLTARTPVIVGAGETFSFWHRYNAEFSTSTPTTGYDGGVLEYSLDGGTTWSDILAAQGTVPANNARFIAGGYNKTISTCCDSAIEGRPAWSGNSGGFVQSTVNLADFVGRSVLFRYRFATDATVTVADSGWWLDDMPVAGFGVCGGGPLPDAMFTDGFESP